MVFRVKKKYQRAFSETKNQPVVGVQVGDPQKDAHEETHVVEVMKVRVVRVVMSVNLKTRE